MFQRLAMILTPQLQLFRRNCNPGPFFVDSLEEDMKKFSLIAILAAFLIGLAGCNTVKGVGKDVAALGNGVDHAATKVSNKM